MREVEFYYLEILNETEQLMIFRTTFNKEPYGEMLVLNTALPVKKQDEQIKQAVYRLRHMNREVARNAIPVSEKKD